MLVSDPQGKLVALFDAKMPVLSIAQRHTFVIGPGRKVLEHTQGGDSVDPSKAVAACALPRPEASSPRAQPRE